jgi:hypothetical protein
MPESPITRHLNDEQFKAGIKLLESRHTPEEIEEMTEDEFHEYVARYAVESVQAERKFVGQQYALVDCTRGGSKCQALTAEAQNRLRQYLDEDSANTESEHEKTMRELKAASATNKAILAEKRARAERDERSGAGIHAERLRADGVHIVTERLDTDDSFTARAMRFGEPAQDIVSIVAEMNRAPVPPTVEPRESTEYERYLAAEQASGHEIVSGLSVPFVAEDNYPNRTDQAHTEPATAATKYQAMPNGEFMIRNRAELLKALDRYLNPPQEEALSSTYSAGEIQRHIIERARKLQLASDLPVSWGINTESSIGPLEIPLVGGN